VTGPPLLDEAHDLYALDPEEFVAARNALARRLKGEGRADDAAAVSTLRRPSRTAWALNQLARRDPELVSTVLRAGHRLAEAISGGTGRAGLGDAQAEERRAISDAVAAAGRMLADAGHAATDAATGRMAETVRAAILDPVVEERLVSGTLETDESAPGFGIGPDLAAAPAPSGAGARAETKAEAKARETRRRQLERAARQARAVAEDAAARAGAARARADALSRQAAEAESAAREAERALEAETGS
jgi:hypothetical protein